MKPFPDSASNPKWVRQSNYILSATRVVIENANARLKNKFQKLSQSVDRACLVTGCSIILHNFIIEHDTHIDLAKAREPSSTPNNYCYDC